MLVGLASTEGPVSRSFQSFTGWRTLFKPIAGRYPAVKHEPTGETPLNFDIRSQRRRRATRRDSSRFLPRSYFCCWLSEAWWRRSFQ